jgi:hypothetical protein
MVFCERGADLILEALTKISGVLVDAFGQGYLLVLALGLYSFVRSVAPSKKNLAY